MTLIINLIDQLWERKFENFKTIWLFSKHKGLNFIWICENEISFETVKSGTKEWRDLKQPPIATVLSYEHTMQQWHSQPSLSGGAKWKNLPDFFLFNYDLPDFSLFFFSLFFPDFSWCLANFSLSRRGTLPPCPHPTGYATAMQVAGQGVFFIPGTQNLPYNLSKQGLCQTNWCDFKILLLRLEQLVYLRKKVIN